MKNPDILGPLDHSAHMENDAENTGTTVTGVEADIDRLIREMRAGTVANKDAIATIMTAQNLVRAAGFVTLEQLAALGIEMAKEMTADLRYLDPVQSPTGADLLGLAHVYDKRAGTEESGSDASSKLFKKAAVARAAGAISVVSANAFNGTNNDSSLIMLDDAQHQITTIFGETMVDDSTIEAFETVLEEVEARLLG